MYLILAIALIIVIVYLWHLCKAEIIDLTLDTSRDVTQNISKIKHISYHEQYLNLPLPLSIIFIFVYLAFKYYTHEPLEVFDLVFLLFVVLMIELILSVSTTQKKSASSSHVYSIKNKSCRGIEFLGNVVLPKKIYEGDSHNISVNLKPNFPIPPKNGDPLFIQDTEGGRLKVMQLLRDSSVQKFLEIEFSAAGLTVDGEKKQSQLLNSQTLSYQWNCYFPNSGNHTLGLSIRLLSLPATIELGTIEYSTKVVKLDHLTKRQVWIISWVAGILSAVLVSIELLQGVW